MKRLSAICLLLAGAAFGAVPEEAVYQWAADVTGIVSKETKAAPRAYLWLPPATVKAKGLVLAQHNMLEEPVFAHPAFRAELAKADVGLVWITPKRLKGPIDIAVVSYDLARKEPSVLTVYRLVR